METSEIINQLVIDMQQIKEDIKGNTHEINLIVSALNELALEVSKLPIKE
ncbi:MAG: hypothetical protein FWD66_00900 [Paludibacter sp.]|nr:hypothetical protein [Paludibacter sp.]